MLARWGKKKALVKIHRMENNVVYLTEEPPGSGMFYLRLVEGGKNVEKFEIVKERQLSLTGGVI